MMNSSMLLPEERLDLLVRLLSFERDAHDIGGLRTELLGDMSRLEAMMHSASRRQLLSAALAQLNNKGVLPPLHQRRTAVGSVLAQLAELDAQFHQRRTILSNALYEIIECLNKCAIQPVVLKGSMSLISGKPGWRFQRDIDIAVDPSQADTMVTALRSAGFRERHDLEQRPHHLKPMQRDDVPALIEPHVQFAGFRARTVLPDDVLMNTVGHHVWKGLSYRAMSNAGFLLHGLAHHHFQNRGYIYGTVSLKGLLEFAFTIESLQGSETVELDSLTCARPRLKAGLLLWCALAKRLLRVRLPQGLTVTDTVERHAEKVAVRYLSGSTVSPLTGVMEHISSTLRHSPQLSSVLSVLPSVRDGCHRALRLDRIAQRRNASGILADD